MDLIEFVQSVDESFYELMKYAKLIRGIFVQKGSSYSDPRWRVLFFVCMAALVLVTAFKISSAARSDYEPTPPQDLIRLETRINQLEQRLYTMEASIRNIEQQSRIASAASRGGSVTADEVSALRSQLQALQLRLMDDECALARLDERTLTPAMREARRKSGAASDPCRANADAPLRLPERRQ